MSWRHDYSKIPWNQITKYLLNSNMCTICPFHQNAFQHFILHNVADVRNKTLAFYKTCVHESKGPVPPTKVSVSLLGWWGERWGYNYKESKDRLTLLINKSIISEQSQIPAQPGPSQAVEQVKTPMTKHTYPVRKKPSFYYFNNSFLFPFPHVSFCHCSIGKYIILIIRKPHNM